MQTEKVIAHIVDWLKTYAENAKCKGYEIPGFQGSQVAKFWNSEGSKFQDPNVAKFQSVKVSMI